MATHIFQKDGESTWYVHIIIPKDVRAAFGGRTKLTKTTGTSNKAEAMERRLPILAKWKAEIAAARVAKEAIRQGWRDEVALEGRQLTELRNAALLKAINDTEQPASAVLSHDEAVKELEGLKRELQASLSRIVSLEKESAVKGIASQIIDHLQTPAARDGIQSAKTVSKIVQTASVQMASNRYGLTTAEIAEAQAIISKPEAYKPRSPITASRLAAFRQYRQKAAIEAKTIDQQESKLQKLSLFLSTEGRMLDHDAVAAWLDSMSLASKTKTQYLLAGSVFWKWAMKYDKQWKESFGKDNPFEDHELPVVRGKAKAEASRKAFTVDELERLYAAAKAAGASVLGDLILLGAYTGCRIEELAQLRTDTIVTIDGVKSFKIEDSKTAAGIREVPIHPALEGVVARLAFNSKDGYLLPSSGKNKYGIRSDPLSKAFGRLKTSLAFGKQHVFHSVRATVVTLLLRADVPGATVANIVGHETGLVTFDVYAEGASPAQKLHALAKLAYAFEGM